MHLGASQLIPPGVCKLQASFDNMYGLLHNFSFFCSKNANTQRITI